MHRKGARWVRRKAARKRPTPDHRERDLAAQPILLRGVYGQHPAEETLAEDQHPVGDFGADGQHEALGEAVRPRTPRRDLDHLDARVRHDPVERSRKLACGFQNAAHAADQR